MYAEVLGSIDGVAIFPIVSLIMFVAFFSSMLVWTCRLGNDRLATFARMPLDTTDHLIARSDRPSQGDLRDPEAR